VSDDVDANSDGVPDCIDECPDDPEKTWTGYCGCGTPETDADGDGVPDCVDQCPIDALKAKAGVCGCNVPDWDVDDDGVLDCKDDCPYDPAKTEPGVCGCGVADEDPDGDGYYGCNGHDVVGHVTDKCPDDANKFTWGTCGCGVSDDVDSDGDGVPDCVDFCSDDDTKVERGVCGCGVPEWDYDGDGKLDCEEECREDADKTEPGVCGCGVADVDTDGDGTLDCEDKCPDDEHKTAPGVCGCGVADDDTDGDGSFDCNDGCPSDRLKILPGVCGCGVSDVDSDHDGVPDCNDQCENDKHKIVPGVCGCGANEWDVDGDSILDCNDKCPYDPLKDEPGVCGCDVADEDSDGDGHYYCNGNDVDGHVSDKCPDDGEKIEPGVCGCGVSETGDSDGDGTADCNDGCPNDGNKIAAGECGCGNNDWDQDLDGLVDCHDKCPFDPAKTELGVCGCGVADEDTDNDGTLDCEDECPDDGAKASRGACGCGVAETGDADGDGWADCVDACPADPAKFLTNGTCGCGQPDIDTDGDNVLNCVDLCPADEMKSAPGECGCGVPDWDFDLDGTYNCLDGCEHDPAKTEPGKCGCGVVDVDSDGDGALDCDDKCPEDPEKTAPGICGCGKPDYADSDGDGALDCIDWCPDDPYKIAAGDCGCGTPDIDEDGDGDSDCLDRCPEGSAKITPGVCGCNALDWDIDGDGVLDCKDGCPSDPHKTAPGECGCGVADEDTDGDQTLDCEDECPFDSDKTRGGICGCGERDDVDSDNDGVADCVDGCPEDFNKQTTGVCGCGVSDIDTDHDGVMNCNDGCPDDSAKVVPGVCGCGKNEWDSDLDEVLDCKDGCPYDSAKTVPDVCGCGVAEVDSDGDDVYDCVDQCPDDSEKQWPGICGCGVAETGDIDADGVSDCNDGCPSDPAKVAPGVCGCGHNEWDSDLDGVLDCNDACPYDSAKTAPGVCGCGSADLDTDGDNALDCEEECPNDGTKTAWGTCGCGVADADSDGDGVEDCIDQCPDDSEKQWPGYCGCGHPDTDTDGDGVADCDDYCPTDSNKVDGGVCGCGVLDWDIDADGTEDCNDDCPHDPHKTVPGVCGCGVPDDDSDGDDLPDCKDQCPHDRHKAEPGVCGCNTADNDADGDGTLDCNDQCPRNGDKVDPGLCGCNFADSDCAVEGDFALTVGVPVLYHPDHDLMTDYVSSLLQFDADLLGADATSVDVYVAATEECPGPNDGGRISLRIHVEATFLGAQPNDGDRLPTLDDFAALVTLLLHGAEGLHDSVVIPGAACDSMPPGAGHAHAAEGRATAFSPLFSYPTNFNLDRCWSPTLSFLGDVLDASYVIVNPNNGAESSLPIGFSWQTALDRVDQADAYVRPLFYVPTDFGDRALPGVLSTVQNYLDGWLTPRGGGLYVDQVTLTEESVYYYRALYEQVDARSPSGTTAMVLNAGTIGTESEWKVAASMLNPASPDRAADTIIAFVGTQYELSVWSTPDWISGFDAERIGAVVYGVAPEDAREVTEQLRARHVGFQHITSVHPSDWAADCFDGLDFTHAVSVDALAGGLKAGFTNAAPHGLGLFMSPGAEDRLAEVDVAASQTTVYVVLEPDLEAACDPDSELAKLALQYTAAGHSIFVSVDVATAERTEALIDAAFGCYYASGIVGRVPGGDKWWEDPDSEVPVLINEVQQRVGPRGTRGQFVLDSPELIGDHTSPEAQAASSKADVLLVRDFAQFSSDGGLRESLSDRVLTCGTSGDEDRARREVGAAAWFGCNYISVDMDSGAFDATVAEASIWPSNKAEEPVTRAMGTIDPLYVYPGGAGRALWDKYVLSAGAQASNRFVVLAPAAADRVCGEDGNIANPDWATLMGDIQTAAAGGAKVRPLGIVETQWCNGDVPMADLKQAIDDYYDCWHVAGIFVNQVTGNERELECYAELYNYVQSKGSFDETTAVLNVGQQPAEAYMAVGDVFVLHSGPLERLQSLVPEQWLYKYPSNKFAAIITEVDPDADVAEIAEKVAVRNIGWSYMLASGDGFSHNGAIAAEVAQNPNPDSLMNRFHAMQADATPQTRFPYTSKLAVGLGLEIAGANRRRAASQPDQAAVVRAAQRAARATATYLIVDPKGAAASGGEPQLELSPCSAGGNRPLDNEWDEFKKLVGATPVSSSGGLGMVMRFDTAFGTTAAEAIATEYGQYRECYGLDGALLDNAPVAPSAAEASYYGSLARDLLAQDDVSGNGVWIKPTGALGEATLEQYAGSGRVVYLLDGTFDEVMETTVGAWARAHPSSRFACRVTDVPGDMIQAVTGHLIEQNCGFLFVADSESALNEVSGMVASNPSVVEDNSDTSAVGVIVQLDQYDEEVWTSVLDSAAAVTHMLTLVPPADMIEEGPSGDWLRGVQLIDDARGSARVRTVGSVNTRYGTRDIADAISEAIAYLTIWRCDGIFIDEAASGASNADYYLELRDAIKSHAHGTLIVLNSRAAPEMEIANIFRDDIIVVFDGTADYFLKWSSNAFVRSHGASHFAAGIDAVPVGMPTFEAIIAPDSVVGTQRLVASDCGTISAAANSAEGVNWWPITDFAAGGTFIFDGGNDMYDSGNTIQLGDGGSAIAYTDQCDSATFGTGKRSAYSMDIEIGGISTTVFEDYPYNSINIAGDTGADNIDGVIDTSTFGYNGWTAFLKQIHSSDDPTIVQIFLTDAKNATQSLGEAATKTNNDYHRVDGVAGATVIYLFAGVTDSVPLDEGSFQEIVRAVVDSFAVSGSTAFCTASVDPASAADEDLCGVALDHAEIHSAANSVALGSAFWPIAGFSAEDGASGIVDGGNDMYDGGNQIHVDGGPPLLYTDGAGLAHNGDQFNMTIDAAGVSVTTFERVRGGRIEIVGHLGADGAGVKSYSEYAQDGFRAFMQQTHSVGDGTPTVVHVWITDAITARHSRVNTDANSDSDVLVGVQGSSVVYLLWGASGGAPVSDADFRAVVDAVVERIAPSTTLTTSTASPTSTGAPAAATTTSTTSAAAIIRSANPMAFNDVGWVMLESSALDSRSGSADGEGESVYDDIIAALVGRRAPNYPGENVTDAQRAATCPSHPAVERIDFACKCQEGYSGGVAWEAGNQRWGPARCIVAACPDDSLGGPLGGCTCNPGFTGALEWSYGGEGHWAGACVPSECSDSVPVGEGLGAECDGLAADGSCVHKCTDGYADNNGGSGQRYTCPGGVFAGTPLECTATATEAEAEASSEASAAVAGAAAGGAIVLVIAAVMLYKKKQAEVGVGVEKIAWERELSSTSLSSRKVVPTELSQEPRPALDKEESWAERQSESPPTFDADSRAISDLYRASSRLSQNSLSRSGSRASLDMTPISRRESAESIELTEEHFGEEAAAAQRHSVNYTAEQVLLALEALSFERTAGLPNTAEDHDDADEPVALGEAPAPPTSIGALHFGLGDLLAESDL
jgi:hypothetical protein